MKAYIDKDVPFFILCSAGDWIGKCNVLFYGWHLNPTQSTLAKLISRAQDYLEKYNLALKFNVSCVF